MTMSEENKLKLAQGRAKARARKLEELNKVATLPEQQFETEIQGEWQQAELEHNDHVIVIEPHGRVIVTKLGLHVIEFMDIDSDVNLLINKAKEYIDNVR